MGNVPEATVERLAKYYFILRGLVRDGVEHVKSGDLAMGRRLKPAQIRKDISYCHAIGERGHGYKSDELLEAIGRTLGLDRDRNVCIIGVGPCGFAFAHHTWIYEQGFPLRAVFDRDPEKVGLEVAGCITKPIHELPKEVASKQIELALVTTDYGGAQDAAESLLNAGVRAMASLADASLVLPAGARALNVSSFFRFAKCSSFLNRSSSEEIPGSSVERLARYYRILIFLERMGIDRVTSMELGSGAGANPLQVRKDISFCGPCGLRGIGYDVPSLREAIKTALGLDREWNLAIMGAGTIGAATVHHTWYQKRGFRVRAIFDCDPNKIGQDIYGLTVHPVEDLREVIEKEDITIGVIATQPAAAQEAADKFVEAGVRAIYNFSESSPGVPNDVMIEDYNFFTVMATLSSFVGA